MKLILKTLLTFVVGFIMFVIIITLLGMLAYTLTGIINSLPSIDAILTWIMIVSFVVVCWRIGDDTVKGVKSKLNRKDEK